MTKGQIKGGEPTGAMLDPNSGYTQYGLTKREHFAGLVMQGVLAHNHPQNPTPNQGAEIAKYAVEIADALLEELEK